MKTIRPKKLKKKKKLVYFFNRLKVSDLANNFEQDIL